MQFDSWYASERLIKYVHRQGWHTICELKHNRKLNGFRLDQLAYALRRRRFTRVRVTAADEKGATYYVRDTTGRLAAIPIPVRVFFSRRHPREKSPAYFMCTDLTRSAQWVLQGYRRRWSCEVDNFYLKTQLGLTEFALGLLGAPTAEYPGQQTDITSLDLSPNSSYEYTHSRSQRIFIQYGFVHSCTTPDE